MPLSDYELHVLQELEADLGRSFWVRLRAIGCRYWRSIMVVTFALLLISGVSVAAPSAAAGPLSAAAGAAAAWQCWWDRR